MKKVHRDTNSLGGWGLQNKSSEKNTQRSRQIVPTSHEEKLPPVNRKVEVVYKEKSGKESKSAEGKEVMNGRVQLC